mmetsp:Transcript_30252/g.50621  ORF Transcript_30252/g.50621 Transcript_30252/m.50621 type:complete len:220 (-) Transcript_30252:1762-2421(-)
MRRCTMRSRHRVTIIDTSVCSCSFQATVSPSSMCGKKGATKAVHSRSERANFGVLFSTVRICSAETWPFSTPGNVVNAYSRCFSRSLSLMPFKTFLSSKLPAVTTSALVSITSFAPNLETILAACSANLSISRLEPSLSKHSAQEMMNNIWDRFSRSSWKSSRILKQDLTGRLVASSGRSPFSFRRVASLVKASRIFFCVAEESISSSRPRMMVIRRVS